MEGGRQRRTLTAVELSDFNVAVSLVPADLQYLFLGIVLGIVPKCLVIVSEMSPKRLGNGPEICVYIPSPPPSSSSA